MKICVIGTGYVGLVVGACLSEIGHSVICCDKDENKILNLQKGIIPIFEPKLEGLIKNNVLKKRLDFTTDIEQSVKNSKVCFVAVGTPKGENGDCDLNYVMEVVDKIAGLINEYKVIVNKSTVPVGTVEKIKEIIKSKVDVDFDVVSNPEFLRQGCAVKDIMQPDRIVIGADSNRAIEVMKEIYAPILEKTNNLFVTDIKTAEMIKYVSNSFLATKISFMNEVANFCEKIGANIHDVRLGISLDKRIGDKFLFSGVGYGGSCFPKDVRAIINTAEKYGCDMKIISAAEKVNNKQKELFVKKIIDKFEGNIKDKTFAVWGLSYKPDTNDMREAPSIGIINLLLENGSKIKVFDPKAMDIAREIFKEDIIYCKNSSKALEGADALILITEWAEFKNPDFSKIKKLLKNPIIFDGRNQYNKEELLKLGFDYIGVGI